MIVQVLTDEVKAMVLRDYQSGLSIWKVRQRYHWLRQCDIRKALEGHVRPKNTQRKKDPDPDELAKRRDEVKAAWSDEVASRRWVGRYLTQAESRGSCLSALFRAMGGDG